MRVARAGASAVGCSFLGLVYAKDSERFGYLSSGQRLCRSGDFRFKIAPRKASLFVGQGDVDPAIDLIVSDPPESELHSIAGVDMLSYRLLLIVFPAQDHPGRRHRSRRTNENGFAGQFFRSPARQRNSEAQLWRAGRPLAQRKSISF